MAPVKAEAMRSETTGLSGNIAPAREADVTLRRGRRLAAGEEEGLSLKMLSLEELVRGERWWKTVSVAEKDPRANAAIFVGLSLFWL